MMNVPFMDCPPRLAETWEWFVACASFDAGDPEPLAILIEKEEIPPEYRAKAGAIVRIAATRRPRKIPAAERMRIAASLDFVNRLCRILDRQSIDIGDQKGLEPVHVRREAWSAWRSAVADAAKELGVSVETVENLMREFRKRIDNWPVV